MVDGGETPERSAEPRVRYRDDVHVTLAVALILICVALGIVGWSLRPQSSGFPPVPSHLAIEVPRSGVTGQEILTRTKSNGATLDVLADGTAPPSSVPAGDEWTVRIDNLGAGRLCTPAMYRSPPTQGGAQQFKVVPQRVTRLRNQTMVQGRGAIYLRLCWSSDAPVNLDGSYLNARFPPLGTYNLLGIGTPTYDADASVTRQLNARAGDTANFTVQSLTAPTSSTASSWFWSTQNSPQAIQLAAVDVGGTQHETYQAFLSGLALGIAGAALIALIQELGGPLHRRRGHSRG